MRSMKAPARRARRVRGQKGLHFALVVLARLPDHLHGALPSVPTIHAFIISFSDRVPSDPPTTRITGRSGVSP